jgi:hypothetical protein
MNLNGSLFVEPGDRVEAVTYKTSEWVAMGTVGIHCDDASTADRIAAAFAELAQKMRDRAHLPATVSAELLEPVVL